VTGSSISTEAMIVAKVLMTSSPDDMTLTMQDAVTRRVQWKRTSIDVDPSAAASVLTTLSQSNTSPISIFPEARLSPSPNPEQLRLPPI
jgi:hypothetical protein